MASDVCRDTFIAAMRAGKVSVSEVSLPDGDVMVTFVKTDLVESQSLPLMVPHRLVMRLMMKFEVPREWAWHPEMIPPDLLPASHRAH